MSEISPPVYEPIPDDPIIDDGPTHGAPHLGGGGEGGANNYFGINEARLTLSRFYGNSSNENNGEEDVDATDSHLHASKKKRGGGAARARPTVDSATYVSLSPAAVAAETALAVGALEPGHMYNGTAAPIGIPPPQPRLLVSEGMEEGPAIANALAADIVASSRTAAAYEAARQQVMLWRRWGDIHPRPVLFGAVEQLHETSSDPTDEEAVEGGDNKEEDAGGEEGAPRGNSKKQTTAVSGRSADAVSSNMPPKSTLAAIQNLRPLCLASSDGGGGGAIRHPTFVPTFQPSSFDDHFFALGLAAAVSQDASVLERAFASTEHLEEKGLLTVRLYSDQRVELPRGCPIGGPSSSSHEGKGAARRRMNRSLHSTLRSTFGGGGTVVSAGDVSLGDLSSTSASQSQPPSAVVTLPIYVTLDTLLPVSRAAHDSTAPAHLDLALGRTYDAVNEFYVAFLAKAFAALKGSYAALNGGSAPEVLRGLVPGDGKYVRWQEGIFAHPAVRDALRRVTGGGRARSIAKSVNADAIEALAAAAGAGPSTEQQQQKEANAESAAGKEEENGAPSSAPASFAGVVANGGAAAAAAEADENASSASSQAIVAAPPRGPRPTSSSGSTASHHRFGSSSANPTVSTASAAGAGGGAKRVSIMEGGVATALGSGRPASAAASAAGGGDGNTAEQQGGEGDSSSAAAKGEKKEEEEDAYRAAGEAALLIQSARRNAEELWWLLQEATLGRQPVLLTNTNVCADGDAAFAADGVVASDKKNSSAFGAVPAPITDAALHVEDWARFNWSYGVTVLAAVELDPSMAIADGYLRAVRRRSKKGQGDVRRLVKVRSAFRSNHPLYAKLRGEWALPRGGGVTACSEAYDDGDDADGDGNSEARALLRALHAEERANAAVDGGNPNWTAYAQAYLQYSVADAEARQSEDCVWWMTIDEVCRHFNCLFTLFNTNTAAPLAPPRALVDAVTAMAVREEERRRAPKDPFKPKKSGTKTTTATEEAGKAPEEKGSQEEEQTTLRMGEASGAAPRQFPDGDESPAFESSPAALLSLLRNGTADDATAVVGDSTTRLVHMAASPSIAMAHPNFPHLLLTVAKAAAPDGLDGAGVSVPEGTDVRFKTIFGVTPNALELAPPGGEETDDEEKSRGLGGTMTSRTGSAVDITVTPQNALQVEIRLSVPRPLAARKDWCVQVFRVPGPHKQQCVRSQQSSTAAAQRSAGDAAAAFGGNSGAPIATFPLHTRVQVRSLAPPQIVTTALGGGGGGGSGASTSSRAASSWGGASVASGYSVLSGSSTASTSSAASSDGSGGFSRSFTFECDVNTGHYNVVVMPDPATTPAGSMYVPDASLVQVSVAKRLNGESFDISLTQL